MPAVVLTGVSRGLGRAVATHFARVGATVCGCARSSDDVNSLQAELGTGHFVSCVDVSSDGAVAEWAKESRRFVGATLRLKSSRCLSGVLGS
jgi:NADP-dependent 3-hydroxy acid dehydrogenase YdfG